MKARAIVHVAPNAVEVRDFELRRPQPDEVVVEAHYTCISPGTELRCLAGKQPDAVPFPYIPGYAMTGTVVEAGWASGLEPGDNVYLNGTQDGGALGVMWGGHASHAVARASDCIELPETADLATASLAHLAAIALNGVRVAAPSQGETVAVVGLGILGQLCARLYVQAGCRVVAADKAEARVEQARRAGVEAVCVEGSLEESVQSVLPHGADIVVDATGSAPVLPMAIALARDVPWGDPLLRGARYVVQGSYPDMFAVPYQAAFRKELMFLIPRDCRPSQRREALEKISSGELAVEDLISDVRPPEDAPATYRQLMDPASGLLTVVFAWNP